LETITEKGLTLVLMELTMVHILLSDCCSMEEGLRSGGGGGSAVVEGSVLSLLSSFV
jgi:hypothetical protein